MNRATPQAVSVVVRKEFLWIRRSWVVPVVALLFALAVRSVVLGATPPATGRGPLTLLALVPDGSPLDPTAVVVFALGRVLMFLVPLVATVVAAGTLAGEYESGTVRTLQSLAVSRGAVLGGKLLARSAAVGGVVALGLSVGAVVTWFRFGDINLAAYGAFVLVSVLFAFVLAGVTVAVSTLVAARSQAIALSLGPFIVFAFLGVDPGVPTWLRTGLLAQPYQLLLAGTHDQLAAVPRLALAGPRVVPSEADSAGPLYLSDGAAILALLAWPAVLLWVALRRYRRRDL